MLLRPARLAMLKWIVRLSDGPAVLLERSRCCWCHRRRLKGSSSMCASRRSMAMALPGDIRPQSRETAS